MTQTNANGQATDSEQVTNDKDLLNKIFALEIEEVNVRGFNIYYVVKSHLFTSYELLHFQMNGFEIITIIPKSQFEVQIQLSKERVD